MSWCVPHAATKKGARQGRPFSITRLSTPFGVPKSLFRSHIGENRSIAGRSLALARSLCFAFRAAARATGAGAGAAAARLAFTRLAGCTFLIHGDLGRDALDDRLRASAIDDLRLRLNSGNRSRPLLLAARLTGGLILVSARLLLRLLVRTARLLLLLVRAARLLLRLLVRAVRLLLFRAALMMLLLLARRLNDDDIVIVQAIIIIAVRAFAVFVAVVALEAFLHLRLCGGNDAVIVFGVLQVVFGHHAVAGAVGIAGELRIFFSDVLGSASDLNVWAGAIVAPRQRISALAVEIVVVVASTAAAAVVTATPATALILLSWPHRSFT
jgi:hypothetical protein